MNLLLGGAAAYGLVVGGLYVLQGSLLFPSRAAALASYPLPPGTTDLQLDTPDGHRLVGHLVPARTGPSRGLLIGFPGNIWNASDFTALLGERLPDVDIAAFYYRGYAPSEGRPGERAFFSDATLIYDELKLRLGPRKVFAAGFSLGSGVAAWLARVRSLDGLVLVTPFDSVEAVARARYRWAPVRPLLRHRFRSDLHLAGCDVPTAVILAEHDRIVPAERSLRLVQVLRRAVLVETIPGTTHNSIYDEERFDGLLRQALDAVDQASSADADRAPATNENDLQDLIPLHAG
jgi:pimeloyl-ACP methyl ester carboxylesterase